MYRDLFYNTFFVQFTILIRIYIKSIDHEFVDMAHT